MEALATKHVPEDRCCPVCTTAVESVLHASESDSQVLVSSVNKESPYYSYVGQVIQDCKSLLEGLRGCSLAQVCRSTNQVAHCLAKTYVFGSNLGEWRDFPPSFLSHILASDMQ